MTQHAHTVEDDSSPVIVLLECGRTLSFRISPPKTGERVWCSYHREYCRVKEGRAEYRIRCRDCRLSRPYGAARLTAELKAASHARRMTHTVDVTQGATVLHTFARYVQPTLDDDTVPPF